MAALFISKNAKFSFSMLYCRYTRRLSSKAETSLKGRNRDGSRQKRSDLDKNLHKSEVKGIVGTRQARRMKGDPDARFMKLWTASETQTNERIKEAIKENLPRRSSWQEMAISSLPLLSELPEGKYDELPDDNESVIFRVPEVKPSITHSHKSTEFSYESETVPSFDKLGVHPKLVVKLNGYGIVTPTIIQQKSLPLIYKGKNVVIQSETGSGKTLVFLLPAVQDPGQRFGTVIIVPTRELASQMLYEAHRLLRDKSIVMSLVSIRSMRL